MSKPLWALSLFVVVGCAAHAKDKSDVGPRTVAAINPPASAVAADDRTPDPTVTDPDKYVAVMENAQVRVLRYYDVPGARTHQHHHPDSVLIALSAFHRQLTFPDGTTRERDFKPGDVVWLPAQTHVGENTGNTGTEVLLVEVKAR